MPSSPCSFSSPQLSRTSLSRSAPSPTSSSPPTPASGSTSSSSSSPPLCSALCTCNPRSTQSICCCLASSVSISFAVGMTCAFTSDARATYRTYTLKLILL